jgi:methylated-DNA-[protein]-cysteine S-methyltransferase
MNGTERKKAAGPSGYPLVETSRTEVVRALREGVAGYLAKAEPPLVGSRRAAAQVAEAAEREGLLDVAYGFADSPFGRLMVAVTPRGLVRLDYPDRDLDESLQELASEISPRILESPKATGQARRELDEYFAGTRREFSVSVDMSPLVGFRRRVLEQTARIPYGSTSTYTDVAKRAGSPRGMRAAGNALGSNPIPIVVPCHRVLRSGGGLGGYTGGLDRKVTLLRLEGVLEG